MAKNLSRDQKRKVQLAEKAKRSREMEIFTPYDGSRYRGSIWVPAVYATERGICEVISESKRGLTNMQVRSALLTLIRHLRDGGPASLGDGEPEVPFSVEKASECVFYNVRKSWRQLSDKGQGIAASDYIGIARTLLYSIEAHGSLTPGGYVTFIEGFIGQANLLSARSTAGAIEVTRSEDKRRTA